MTRLKELMPAMEEPETVEPAEKEQVKKLMYVEVSGKLMYVEVSGIAISMIEPRPRFDPGMVEIHVSGASAKSSPFVVSLEEGRGIFVEIMDQLRTDATGDLDKLIARAKQAFYSNRRLQ